MANQVILGLSWSEWWEDPSELYQAKKEIVSLNNGAYSVLMKAQFLTGEKKENIMRSFDDLGRRALEWSARINTNQTLRRNVRIIELVETWNKLCVFHNELSRTTEDRVLELVGPWWTKAFYTYFLGPIPGYILGELASYFIRNSSVSYQIRLNS